MHFKDDLSFASEESFNYFCILPTCLSRLWISRSCGPFELWTSSSMCCLIAYNFGLKLSALIPHWCSQGSQIWLFVCSNPKILINQRKARRKKEICLPFISKITVGFFNSMGDAQHLYQGRRNKHLQKYANLFKFHKNIQNWIDCALQRI